MKLYFDFSRRLFSKYIRDDKIMYQSSSTSLKEINSNKMSMLSQPSTSNSSLASTSYLDNIFKTEEEDDDDVEITVDGDDDDDVDEDRSQTQQSELNVAEGCGPNEFYFETDHPALKANSDYRKLLHTVLVLESLRSQAIRDLDKLHECRSAALSDPMGFVAKLQKGEDLGIPKPQRIPELPSIDWDKYSLTNVDLTFSKRQLTRQSTKAAGDVIGMLSKPDGKNKAKTRSDKANSDKAKFFLPWTAEEQKRLESLLMEYPPEEVETRRWEKIANALGNRTPVQVASRVQKYFIKLLKAGMPIPGRQPNLSYLRKPRRQVIRHLPSTFMVSHTLPVYINEEDEEGIISNGYSRRTSFEDSSSDMDFSDEDDIEPELKNTQEYQELLCIKKALMEKEGSTSPAQHIGFKCAHCEFEPIIGVRYHCTECPVSQSVDFCEDCVNSNCEMKSHLPSHRLEAIKQSTSAVIDRDYMHFADNDYNYLDPNYMPSL